VSSNVEIKARTADLNSVRARAEALADGPVKTLVQEDTFYLARTGRLKLRCSAGGDAELISYDRPDSCDPRPCEYHVVRIGDAASLRAALAQSLGVRGTVRKTRQLLLRGRTRIHLDSVEGLGDFVELEVVLTPGESPDCGRQEAFSLMEELGLARNDLVAGAYIDLLEQCRLDEGA
jgi:adenylate cyclase